eukprot:12399998-Karenia_brevis.AAC.1
MQRRKDVLRMKKKPKDCRPMRGQQICLTIGAVAPYVPGAAVDPVEPSENMARRGAHSTQQNLLTPMGSPRAPRLRSRAPQ